MLQRPAEAVDFPHEHDVKLPPMGIGHEAVQFRAGLLRAGYALVNILPHDFPPTAGCVFTQLRQLHLGVLAVQRGYSGVQCGSHNLLFSFFPSPQARHSTGASTAAGWNSPTCAPSPFMASRVNRTTLARLTPYFFPTAVSDIPERRSRTNAEWSMSRGARPMGRPSRRRLCIPALIRSIISERSSSAMHPRIVTNMRPIAPEVSIFSRAEMNSIPKSFSSSMTVRKCLTERATRSNAATNTMENLRRCASASMASKPLRLALEPDTPISVYSWTTSKPRRAASSRSGYNWLSICWS